MGDEGRLYVSEAIPPAYKALLHDADLIVPNSFEAELLSGVKITDKQTLVQAITILHKDYHVPHVMVTSVRMVMSKTDEGSPQSDTLTVVGSSCRSDFTPRMFSIKVPALPIMFSGTGDMFAALTLVRLREASKAFHVPLDTTVSTDANPNTSPNQPRSASSSRSLLNVQSWQPPDDVEAKDLPLARATERTLASMHAVLSRTAKARDIELASNAGSIAENPQAEASSPSMQEEDDNKAHVRRTTASEVRIVQGVNDIKSPPSQLGERGEGGGGGESVKDAPDSELNLFVAEQVRQ
ncbi:MAG: hypothetical protein M1831_007444 [Alyxoria varia]|nr:MAG: hypothetical protein M1831_007444 [Alyxoria varia]